MNKGVAKAAPFFLPGLPDRRHPGVRWQRNAALQEAVALPPVRPPASRSPSSTSKRRCAMSFARERSTGATTIAEINITPLVDVLLTVLIIFMVTTPLLTKRIDLPLQAGDQGKAVEPRVLGLSIQDNGELVLEGQSLSRSGLDQSLRVAAAGGPVQLDIRPQAHSSYDNLANVLATAQNNGIKNLRVMSVTPD
ncbi:ExbD/TolR family protein [Dokdonella immobilis]|nr:biopolymer transporter ExbD [Dokdonella immobilis]